MPNRPPERPDSLRAEASAHRVAAAAETDPRRRRAYIFIASEYDSLADAIERELNDIDPPASACCMEPSPPLPSGVSRNKSR